MSFVAPLMLIGVPLLIGLLAMQRQGIWRAGGLPGAWRHLIAPDLARYLSSGRQARLGVPVLCCWVTALLVVTALARPMLGAPQPQAIAGFAGRVIVLDLGGEPDMGQMRLFARRLAETAPDLPTALVVAGGEPYTIVPFTVDAAQMSRYLNVVAPTMIPADGRALHAALAHAEGMIARAGHHFAQIVITSPGAPPEDAVAIAPSSTDRVFVTDTSAADWQTYAGTFDARVHGFDDAAAVTDSFVRRAGSTAAAHQIAGNADLSPAVIVLAMMAWLVLFRRRSVT